MAIILVSTTGLEQLIRKMRVPGSGAQQEGLGNQSRTLSGLQNREMMGNSITACSGPGR